jgi:hypothetical protein
VEVQAGTVVGTVVGIVVDTSNPLIRFTLHH